MAWNEPGGNNNKKDPWQRDRNNGSDDGSFDFTQISDLFSNLFGAKKDKQNKFGGNGNDNEKRGGLTGLYLVAGVLAILVMVTGFYTVPEAERGVVLLFGKYYDEVEPGLHFRVPLVQKVTSVNIEQIRALQSNGSMLTEDENVVNVEMDVQYRITNPREYLYSVVDPDATLNEATDSALRYVIGHTTMDDVLTNGREKVRQSTWELLSSIIEPYKMGITIVDVNFLPARAPEQVKAAFDDAISAQEDEQRFKREAEAYENEVLPVAEGKARRIVEEAEAYSRGVVAKAEGDVSRFRAILPEYRKSPEITKRRIYLETMEEVYGANTKVILDNKNNGGNNGSVLYLPLDKIMQGRVAPAEPEVSSNNVGKR